MILWSTSTFLRLEYKTVYELNHLELRLMPHQVLHPSHLFWVFIIFQISWNLHVDSYTYNSYLSEKDFLSWCSFSASSKNFLQVPCFNLYKISSFFPDNSFEKLLQDFCPFCILFIYLYTFPLPVYYFKVSSFTIWVSASQFLTNKSFSGLPEYDLTKYNHE